MAGDGFAIDAFRLFAEKLDEGRAIGDLALGLGMGFALLCGQDGAQIVGVFHHQFEPLAHHSSAFLTGPLRPVFLRRFRLRNRAGNLRAGQVSNLGDHIPPRRISHRERAVFPVNPLSTDVSPGFQQAWVFEKRFQICRCVQHGSPPRK